MKKACTRMAQGTPQQYLIAIKVINKIDRTKPPYMARPYKLGEYFDILWPTYRPSWDERNSRNLESALYWLLDHVHVVLYRASFFQPFPSTSFSVKNTTPNGTSVYHIWKNKEKHSTRRANIIFAQHNSVIHVSCINLRISFTIADQSSSAK